MSSDNRNPDQLLVEEGITPEPAEREPTLFQKCLRWSGSVIIYLLCHSILSIFLIIIGAINLHNCPINDGIPIWLIIPAAYAIARGIIEITAVKCTKTQTQTRVRRVFALTDFANVVYFIWGAVIIYSVYSEVSYDKNSGPRYCNPWVYRTGFIMVLIAVVATLMALLAACCTVISRKKN